MRQVTGRGSAMRCTALATMALVSTAFGLPACSSRDAVQPGPVGGSASAALQVVNGTGGVRETVAALPGSGLSLVAVTLPDTGYLVGANRSKLRILHLAAAGPPLTIWRTQADFQTPISIVTPYSYLVSAIVESTPNEWSVRVCPAATGSWTLPASAITVTIPAGQLRTVATLDAPGGGGQLKVMEP